MTMPNVLGWGGRNDDWFGVARAESQNSNKLYLTTRKVGLALGSCNFQTSPLTGAGFPHISNNFGLEETLQVNASVAGHH